jgi:hypothetical protein
MYPFAQSSSATNLTAWLNPEGIQLSVDGAGALIVTE